MADAPATGGYPQSLVQQVKANVAEAERLAEEQRTLGTEFSQTNSDLETARKKLSLFERMSGPVRKWAKRSTPALEEVWSTEEERSRLERLIAESSENSRDVELGSYSAITSYLFHSSERYRGLASDQRRASAALSESADYLGLVQKAADDIDSLVQRVMEDWPHYGRKPFQQPQRRHGPVRIMGEGTADAALPSEELEEMDPSLYDPDKPDEPEGEVWNPFPLPPRPHPPHDTWPGYWRVHWRTMALRDCQAAVGSVKGRKAGYADTMRTYASRRNAEAGPLPSHWDADLSGVESAAVDDVPWYTVFHPAAFIYALGNVHSQLVSLREKVRTIKALPESDLRYHSDEMSDMAAKVKADILSSN